MEQNKKRRNSILKKKTATDEETTTEIKARRISFSGKKSVKEFIAGEEAATIWGTSYEESADDLHGNSTERSLVNVNAKRIELRNRRVVVEPPQPQKRRSASKKKVLIAENDKENLCVRSMQQQPVENQLLEAPPQPPPPICTVEIKEPKPQSPIKTELALVNSHDDTSKIRDTMLPSKRSADPISICSSTFDFINYSGQINKTVSIEQSVEVTLSDFELQMFRFRVPVRATDISPNLSVNSQRDLSSPNILSQSILMSAEELKTMKVQKSALNDAIEKNKVDEKVTSKSVVEMDVDMDIEETNRNNQTTKATDNQTMEITQISDAKRSKRKSDRTAQSLIKDSILDEINSPLRKKAMHTLYSSSMDVTNKVVEGSFQNQPNRRPTINQSVAVDESVAGNQSLDATNTSRYTISDHITINESTIHSHTTASCLAMGDEIENISMELSMCENNNSKTSSDIAPAVQFNKKASQKTINFSQNGQMEHSLVGGQRLVDMNAEANGKALKNKTIKSPIHILEDSIQTQPTPEPTAATRHTLGDSVDIEEVTEPFHHADSSSNMRKQRQSIHTPIDMVEESSNHRQSEQRVKSSFISFLSKGLKVRQTILTPKDIIEDSPKDNEPSSDLQKTIKTPLNIFEDSIQAEAVSKSGIKSRQTIYDSADIEEDQSQLQQEMVLSKSHKARDSVYTQSDMIESSPKPAQSENINEAPCLQKLKVYSSGLKIRQTTYSTEDIVVDSTEEQLRRTAVFEVLPQSVSEDSQDASQLHKPKAISDGFKMRKSIFTPEDIVEDSPKAGESKSLLQRTIKTPFDICEDTPRAKPELKTIGKSRKSVYEPAGIEEETFPIQHGNISSRPQSKTIVKGRETIFDSVDIEEEASGTVQHRKSTKPRSSVYTPSDMMEESPKPSQFLKADNSSKSSEPCHDLKTRQEIFTQKDISEVIPDNIGPVNVLQKTIKTPITIFEDSIQDQPVSKTIVKARQTIYEPADIEEETDKKPRKSIHTLSDMIEEYPEANTQNGQLLRKTKASKGSLKLRRTIFTPEGMVVDSAHEPESRNVLQKPSTTGIQSHPASKPSVVIRKTFFESADIEEDLVPDQRVISISKTNRPRESIHFPTDMIEDSPKPTQPLKVESKPRTVSGSVRVRHTILTPKDITAYLPNDFESESILQRTVKTPIEISEDCQQMAPAHKSVGKSRQTIYDSSEIDEETAPVRHAIASSRSQYGMPIQRRETINDSVDIEELSSPIQFEKSDKPRKSVFISDVMEESPKPTQQVTASISKNIIDESKQKTIKSPITVFEDSIQDEPVLKPVAKGRQTIYDSADIEEETVSIPEVFVLSKINKTRESLNCDMVVENPKTTLPHNTHKGQFFQKPVASSSGLKHRQTIYTPEDIIVDSAKGTGSRIILQEVNSRDDTFQSEVALRPYAKYRQTIFESADIEEVPVPDQRACSIPKTNKARESIHIPSNMIEDSPKPETQPHPGAASNGPRVRKTITTREDIVEDAQKTTGSKSMCDNYKDDLQAVPSQKSTHRNRKTVYDFADIEEDRVPIQNATATSEPQLQSIPKGRHTIYHSADITENTVPIENCAIVSRNNRTTNTHIGMNEESSKPLTAPRQKLGDLTSGVRRTIFTLEDIAIDAAEKEDSRNISEKSTKTDRFRDPQQFDLTAKPSVKSRPTIFESTDIEQDSEPISISKTIRPRESIYLPTDMVEDSPKPAQPQKAQYKQEPALTSLRVAPALKPISKSRQTIYDSADIEEETVPVNPAITSSKEEYKKNNKGRQTIYDSVDVEEASGPTHHGIALKDINKASKSVYAHIDMVLGSPIITQDSLQANSAFNASQEIQTEQLPAFTRKCLFEDTSNSIDNRNEFQKTNKTPFHIFEDSIQAETVFDAVDVEENSVPIQHSMLNSKINKPRESIYSQNDIIEDSPSEVLSRPGGFKARQTILAQESIIQDVPKETEFQNTFRKTFKTINDISQDNLPVEPKPIRKSRQTIYDYADIEEETVPIQQTTASSNPAFKSSIRETVYNSADIEETLGYYQKEIVPNRSTNSRKSVYASIDMDIDSPKTTNLTQKSNKPSQRQTIYESFNVISDSSKTVSLTRSTEQPNHIQTNTTSLKEKANHRHTVHNPLDMIHDSPELKTDARETTEELLQHGEHLILEKESDLLFRKPAKLFSGKPKSPENLFQSPKALMDQVIQDMGCSMDLQVLFPSDPALQKQSFFKTNPIELETSMNLSVAGDARHDTAQLGKSMELSMATETIPNPLKQRTMHLNENVEVSDDSDSLANLIKHSRAQINRKTIHFRKNMDWEDNQVSKYLETPSKFDRSLAEYLKAEAAALRNSSKEISKEDQDQEEEIFYDAEDGVAEEILNEKRQTCHVPVQILEESGIQPIQLHVLKRQTTYSPKDMTNESIDDGQSKLTAKKDDDIDLTTRPNVSDNRNQKQFYEFARKCLFQKSMEVTQTSDTTTNETKKPILMKSRLDLHVSKLTNEISSMKSANEELKELETSMDQSMLMANTDKPFSPREPFVRKTIHFSNENAIVEENKEHDSLMDQSMVIGNADKPLSPREPFVRKTIHFPNENAVDESFFDENTSKLNRQRNRKTLHFNEPIQTTDLLTTTKKPSSTVQSVKEMLLENTRLFSQTNLLKPSTFEKQRSTIFFADKDNSMEVSAMDCGPIDPESTPTKNKISRIPQLIGSAKKLESMKKSMEFIQQELPNLGCNYHHELEEDSFKSACESPKMEEEEETPRRFSTSVPKKLSQQFELPRKESNFKPKQLENSFDTIEIPRKAIVTGTKAKEKSPRKVVRHLQESFDTIEIPRKVLSSVRKTIEESPQKEEPQQQLEEPSNARLLHAEPGILQESFDTVEIPRRATTFQRNDTTYFCPNEMETTTNATQKSLYQFEDAPITISDVSTFFAQKQLQTAEQDTAKYSLNTTQTLCKLNVNELQGLPRSSDSDDATTNLAKYQKRYIDLTCNSLELSSLKDAIEKTHLSLVNTLDEESEMVNISPEIELANEIPAVTASPKEKQEPLKPVASVCRKCKRHRLSVTQNDTTIGSFMLEPLPIYKMDLNALWQLESKPKLTDVGNILRQKLRESNSFNISDGSRSTIVDEDDDSDDSVDIDSLVLNLEKERLLYSEKRQRQLKEVKAEKSFVHRVRKKMQSKSNWILNDLLLINNVLRLSHTRIRTFAIFIDFTPKDPRGIEVNFNKIQLLPNRLHSRQWKPFEYVLHYQLLVELPFDLKKICPTSDHFFEFLEYVEQVVEGVLKTGKDMLSIVLSSPASLIRDPSGSLYIRKYVRTKTPQNEVKRTEIHIEVRNIKKLSYESITMPPLYEFHENIQLLPVGHNFLRIFLDDPLKFIK